MYSGVYVCVCACVCVSGNFNVYHLKCGHALMNHYLSTMVLFENPRSLVCVCVFVISRLSVNINVFNEGERGLKI